MNDKAVIWDMDGVIADTAPYHLQGWRIVFGKRGTEYTEEDYWRNTGKRSDSIVRNILGDDMPDEDVAAIVKEKDETFQELIARNIRSFPGVLELMAALRENNFKMAIASSAPMQNIQLIVQGLKIENLFDAIISGWEVTRGKPNPQTFLLAAEKLGIGTKNCVVIEDAISGVTASKRAGIRCIAVTNTTSREELREADIITDTLEKITVTNIINLLNETK
ncbi:HAD family hydrolase [Chloroflexota bacterium]